MNKFKTINATDRYGVKYTKIFIIWADGGVSLQRYDSVNNRIKTIDLK